jgi:iron complex outermembrane receptor protein
VRFSTLVLGLVVVTLSAPLTAQQQTGTVTGTVTAEAGAPLANAGVVLVGTARTAVTNARGEYRLTAPAGTHTLRARVIGYAGAEQRVTVGAGETVTANFRLAPSALALSEVTVIGSRTARTAVETPVPVDVISTEEIQEAGQTEVNQILATLAPSFNASHQTIADGTDHINPASLRGLGPDQVLVLVNGKRRHTSALVFVNGTFGRGTVGVDLNAIPTSAIGRIEVLRDGAAAQYGSDAIAGVINIVLKEQTDRIELTTTAGTTAGGKKVWDITSDHDGDQVKTEINYGLGVGSRGFFNIAGEFLDRGATSRAAPYTGNDIFRGVTTQAGTDSALLVNGLTREDFTIRLGQAAATVGMAFYNTMVPLSDDAEFYSFGGISHRDGVAAGFYRLPSQEGRVVPQLYPFGFLPDIHTVLDDNSSSAGVRGALNGWDVDFSVTHGTNALHYFVENSNNASMGTSSPTTFDAGQLSFGQTVGSLDLLRPLGARLGLQSLSFVGGGEFRREEYRIDAGEEASWQLGNGGDSAGVDFDTTSAGAPKESGAQVFPGFQPANELDRSRNSVSMYAGLESQVTDRFLVDVAGRFESYSDFGRMFNGKVAARLELAPRIALRGAASTGFRAPSLAQVWFNNVSNQFTIDGSGNLILNRILTSNNQSRVTKAFGIPDLTEETSVNLSAGITAWPRPNLSLTVDLYRTTIDGRIVLTSQFSSLPAVEPNVAIRSRIAQILAPFQAQGVTTAQFFTNAVDTKTLGADIVLAYATALGGGTLSLTGSASFTTTDIERVNVPQAMADSFASGNLDTVRVRIQNPEDRNRLEDGLPRQKGSVQARWQRGRLGVLGRTTYYGSIEYHHPTNPANDEHFGAKTLVDLDLSYQLLDGVRLAVGGSNIFNTYPDQQVKPANVSLGRFIYSRRVTQFGMNGGFYYARLALAL